MSEEQKSEAQPVEVPTGLAEILRKYPTSPSTEQVEAWKTKYGNVFVSGFSEEELFIWKPITRPEWVRLQTMAADPENKMDQFKFEELVCETAVLWKSVSTSWAEGKAGTPQALNEQILSNSNFLTPQQASLLVAKL